MRKREFGINRGVRISLAACDHLVQTLSIFHIPVHTKPNCSQQKTYACNTSLVVTSLHAAT